MSEKNKENKEVKEAKEVDLNTEIEKLKAEVEDWKNKYYMAYADTQNLQKNLEKEHQAFIKYRSMGFVEKLLPALDCFNTALRNEPDDQVLRNYLIGFKYVYKMLVDALTSEGVSEIEPKAGDKFDFNTMEAVEAIESETPDIIQEVRRKGYMLHDRIIKHAQVVVTKLPEENKGSESNKESENDSEEKLSEESVRMDA
ncbi:MAG: nucleotide exchange factor GrpE [Bacilli bacterium]